jgi:hypothetical protein
MSLTAFRPDMDATAWALAKQPESHVHLVGLADLLP